MALSALTLTVSKAISGRRFRSKLNGLTAGTTVEVDRGASSSGFGELNGFLVNPCVSLADLPTVVITERVPGTGENRTTKLIIEVLSQNEVRRQSEELGTFRQPYAAPQEDGSELWTIRAGGVGGEPVDETAGVEVPAAVSDLTATAVSDTEIEIDWTAAVGATSHQYRLDGGTATTGTGPPMTIAELDAETGYDFEVRGVNGDGSGAWSNVASETTESGGSPAWVPAGALAFLDFENGHYWDGVSELAVAAVISHPEYVTANGLEVRGGNPVMKLVAGAALPFLETSRTQVIVANSYASKGFDMLANNDGDTTEVWDFGISYIDYHVYMITYGPDGFGGVDDSDTTLGLSKTAFSYTPTATALSRDGAAIVTSTSADVGLEPATEVLFAGYSFPGSIGANYKADVHSLTIYPLQANSALPGLST